MQIRLCFRLTLMQKCLPATMKLALVAIFWAAAQVSAENVLFLYPMASPSHKNIGAPIMFGLADRGHNVTMVSSFKTEPHKNVRDIQPLSNFDYLPPDLKPLEMRGRGLLGMVFFDYTPVLNACHKVFQHEEFRDLLNEKFDLVVMDAFANNCLVGFISKLGVPFILVSSSPVRATSVLVGNRLPPSFVPNSIGAAFNHKMNFWQRVSNMLIQVIINWGFSRLRPTDEQIYKEYLGNDLPPIDTLLSNVSLILSNSHFSFNFPIPTLPDVVEIGAIHCRPGRPVPQDLNNFLNDAADGFILFSLGSIVRPHELPEVTRKVFVNVFSRLKQRVLWKWPLEMPDSPPNVKLLKWVPQQDVLAHPSIRVFITHGGLLSTQESIYHGVPMVDIPVFGDQDFNAKLSTDAGIAVTVQILDITEEKLESAINRVLSDKSFKKRVEKLSSILRDQPETPQERAVFWAEYVMRNKGAHHLRSAARELNFFQYYCLDVVAVLLAVIVIALAIVYLVLRTLLRFVIGMLCKAGRKHKSQ